ncbi:hypothetical protein [Photobacterium kishitanii]|uniref:hypothetical protein n=1 Tax=Photobacterium kishitanii TaxID=318456 RepID=UPI0015E74395|nr:hypothetical protein [Photobacterium kishitanii]
MILDKNVIAALSAELGQDLADVETRYYQLCIRDESFPGDSSLTMRDIFIKLRDFS